MPFFLIESAYEKEQHATERRLRTQARQAILSGAAGQVFGNNPRWHFNSERRFCVTPLTWQDALGSRGAQSMTHLRDLLTAGPWWSLEPDTSHTLLTNGLGAEEQRAAAARTGRWLVCADLPAKHPRHHCRSATDDRTPGDRAVVRSRRRVGHGRAWIALSRNGTTPLSAVPTLNDAGFEDWVLILKAQL
jgi:hypothetical protein